MSAKALSLSKQIVSEIKLANTTFTMNGKKLDKSFLQGPMSEFLSTSKVFGKSAKELEHLASSYATYLRSTRILSELQDRYAGREKTIAESARLVGLELPKKNN
uniref:Protein FMC1 homolog n=1 Tax=Ditylenchus dipsaci TaxID=166011 RepID=A0A915DPT7_9BILA